MAKTPRPNRVVPSNYDDTTEPADPPDPDLLAAVVLQTLVSTGRGGLSLAQVARACERDLQHPSEVREVQGALQLLIDDELAARDDTLYRPTRAAVRAAELSF